MKQAAGLKPCATHAKTEGLRYARENPAAYVAQTFRSANYTGYVAQTFRSANYTGRWIK